MQLSLHGCTTKDFSLRRHSSNLSDAGVDRISSLSDDLLVRVLSLLSTKDAAAMSVLSKRMRRLLPWITTLDFNDSPISHCLTRPYQSERFLTFQMFVDAVLQKYMSPHLSKFRLQFGGDKGKRYVSGCTPMMRCKEGCFPFMCPSHLYAWICFPLTRFGLKEMELSIHLSNSCQLPIQLFTCETLEVLKLDVSLDLGQVCAMPSFGLPNLKVFHLHAVLIPGNDFLTRLASSCPLLEELDLYGYWDQAEIITISSLSLQRLRLTVYREDDMYGDLLHIDTPKLQYFFYSDDLAHQYSISNMNSLVEADMDIGCISDGTLENSFQSMIYLLRVAQIVQRLHLGCACVEALDLGNSMDQLPTFLNLKRLELGQTFNSKWDKVLLGLLHCSPNLETLVFPLGLCATPISYNPFESEFIDPAQCSPFEKEAAELECKFFRMTQAIPLCCRSHLKRIEIGKFWGLEREMEVIKFFLRHAVVLETLVICDSHVDLISLERAFRNLPTASAFCSIEVR